MKALDASILKEYVRPFDEKTDRLLHESLKKLGSKIIVIDDDPTGVQTVHDISVYTDWSEENIRRGFEEENSMFYILTNSRSMTARETEKVQRDIAERACRIAKEKNTDFIFISRSDSTLRGHYPLEPETLREVYEKQTGRKIDGEIIYPFFPEGGRYTLGNVHYVLEGDRLTPAGETEFAKDKTFGYVSSDLTEWCEEKSGGKYKKEDVIAVPLELLRGGSTDAVTELLMSAEGFAKIIVNSMDYNDVKVFAAALAEAMIKGKRFIIRSAAAIAKELGGVSSRPLLTREELLAGGGENGGVIIVGSHVNKTTRQLEILQESDLPVEFIEFDQHRVLEEGGLEDETAKAVSRIEKCIKSGRTAAVYTRRDRFDLDTDDKEEQLKVSVRISDAVTDIVSRLSVRPGFIISKGGITSSDIGTKALGVKRARVMGQILPGIPVWETDADSKFPNMAYVIFPGNVGSESALYDMVKLLLGK